MSAAADHGRAVESTANARKLGMRRHAKHAAVEDDGELVVRESVSSAKHESPPRLCLLHAETGERLPGAACEVGGACRRTAGEESYEPRAVRHGALEHSQHRCPHRIAGRLDGLAKLVDEGQVIHAGRIILRVESIPDHRPKRLPSSLSAAQPPRTRDVARTTERPMATWFMPPSWRPRRTTSAQTSSKIASLVADRRARAGIAM